ncbi:uncharacterized protein LOC112687781 [Sipha flava]|uniref:Uncharacterized protein LOC112687781 n=1 Tax=Sipha flava TaxID=143950 RepID=A0A8B8G1H4_9HEMI|nr:uncharacterized protein LOC112687781 [Sipha flava]
MIYGNETNKEIYINSDISNDVESEFYSDDDISINSDKSDLNIMITDEHKKIGEIKQTNLSKLKKKIINSKRLSKYTSPCSDIRRVLNTSGLRSTSLSVILNGNLLPAVKVNKEKILIFNTCAFDSLLVAKTIMQRCSSSWINKHYLSTTR